MKTLKVFGIIVAIAFIAGAYFYPKSTATFLGGAIGDTQSTPKMNQFVGNGNGTYVSVDNQYRVGTATNGDASDRYIETIEPVYTGLTTVSTSTAAMVLRCATTTTATAGIAANSNAAFYSIIATSSPTLGATGTTTIGMVADGFARIWKSGSVLACNANATTSAAVDVKVTYISL